MPRTFIASILSAAIALGSLGSAAPAHAGNNDLQRLLGGIATVVILGATYDHFRDKRQRKNQPTPPPEYKPRPHTKTLRSQCLRHSETRRGLGGQRYYSKHCLRENMRHAKRLPRACEIRVYDRYGKTDGYAPQCLRDYGWRRG